MRGEMQHPIGGSHMIYRKIEIPASLTRHSAKLILRKALAIFLGIVGAVGAFWWVGWPISSPLYVLAFYGMSSLMTGFSVLLFAWPFMDLQSTKE
jgi:uncharacterized membrane protein HdeD (DUF308 family)